MVMSLNIYSCFCWQLPTVYGRLEIPSIIVSLHFVLHCENFNCFQTEEKNIFLRFNLSSLHNEKIAETSFCCLLTFHPKRSCNHNLSDEFSTEQSERRAIFLEKANEQFGETRRLRSLPQFASTELQNSRRENQSVTWRQQFHDARKTLVTHAIGTRVALQFANPLSLASLSRFDEYIAKEIKVKSKVWPWELAD